MRSSKYYMQKIYKFYDLGITLLKAEPFKNYLTRYDFRTKVMKMSKSKGNVINPDDIVQSHGADMNVFTKCFGTFNAALHCEKGLDGSYRFLDRLWQW